MNFIFPPWLKIIQFVVKNLHWIALVLLISYGGYRFYNHMKDYNNLKTVNSTLLNENNNLTVKNKELEDKANFTEILNNLQNNQYKETQKVIEKQNTIREYIQSVPINEETKNEKPFNDPAMLDAANKLRDYQTKN